MGSAYRSPLPKLFTKIEIANDEQLIGAELYHGKLSEDDADVFLGVAFLKCKITK